MMEHVQREFFVSRIVSGALNLHIDDKDYYIKNLDKYQRYKAQLVYQHAVREAELYGLWNEQDVMAIMILNGFWSNIEEQLIVEHQKNIEDFKIALYEAQFHSSSRFAIRTKLLSAKAELERLNNKKHSLDYLTSHSIGLMARLHYTICNALYDDNGQKVYKGDEWENGTIDNLDYIVDTINSQRINEVEFRELARTEPWRLIWTSSKTQPLFDIPASDYTDEQKLLVFWSRLYDSIHEHSEAPSDEVIEDDDMLDGWLLKQRRIREKEKNKQAGDNLIKNSRIKNADEIYLVAETPEDAKRIYDMNDIQGRIAVQSTQNLLNTYGKIEHKKLPHVQKLVLERAAELHKYMKG